MPKRDDHYALLVAITRYPGLSNLRGPENDAEDFRKWLLDEAGGNLDEKRIELICSSSFPPINTPENPDEANPAETEFKKVLNHWLRRKDENGKNVDWLDRVGERLYLFFAGHGFTANDLPNPALFTAQAQDGDPTHIAALRYAERIRNAGFFDQIILVMDCCQDVVKSWNVGEPIWKPPDRNASERVILWSAFAAPRGKKAFETPGEVSPARGYFSTVFMKALRNAPADADGYVTARAVEEIAVNEWDSGGYAKLTGVTKLPIEAPRNLRLYRRTVPSPTMPSGPGPDGSDLDKSPGPRSPGPVASRDEDYFEVEQGQSPGRNYGSSPGSDSLIDTTIAVQDSGALIRVLDTGEHEVASGIGRLPLKLQAGKYTARFRVGDEVQDRPFELQADQKHVQIDQGLLAFSSPVPLPDTSTTHEFQYDPAMELGGLAVQRAYQSGFPASVGTLIVFARDSAHRFGAEWPMHPIMREGLRLRKLDEEQESRTSCPASRLSILTAAFVLFC